MEHEIVYTILAAIIAFLLWQNRNLTLFTMAKEDAPALHHAKQAGRILKKKKKDDGKGAIDAAYMQAMANGSASKEVIKQVGINSRDGDVIQ